MRFRYLVAVPFTDHGSEVESHAEVERKTVVVPRARLSQLDFSLLAPGFAAMPSTLCGLPAAEFEFVPEANEVRYQRFPEPDAIWESFIADSQLLGAFLIRYGGARSRLADALEVCARAWEIDRPLSEEIYPGPALAALARETVRSVDVLLASAAFDEYGLNSLLTSVDGIDDRLRLLTPELEFPWAGYSAGGIVGMKRVRVPTDPPQLNLIEWVRETQGYWDSMPGTVPQLGPEVITVLQTLSEDVSLLWAMIVATISAGVSTLDGSGHPAGLIGLEVQALITRWENLR